MTTPTSIESVNDAKRAHADSIISAIEAVNDLILSQPDLWFGGLPPVLAQVQGMFAFHTAQMRQQFGLPAPEPEA